MDIYAVAVGRVGVELDAAQLERVRATHLRVQGWGMEKYPMYGVNTGFGELINVIIPPQFKSDLQHNLLRSHAAGGGEPFPDEVVRAIMTVRINCLMKGYSGISPEALQLLATMLNRGIHPVIPMQGSLGASGDLAPLSHMALPLIGDGHVRKNGVTRPTMEVFQEEGLTPLKLGFKEGLALVNGTSAMTGAASLALYRARHLLRLSLLASADIVQAMNASTRPFSHTGNALKNHPGQVVIARLMRDLTQGTGLMRDHQDIMRAISERTSHSNDVEETEIYLQNAYSLRCMPQVLGVVLETLQMCQRFIEEEANSVNDNPVILDTPAETYHGANFHGQYVAMACDYLSIAVAEMGVLAERQLNRLLDPHINKPLPGFLAHAKTGLFCGFEGGQYLATSIASENLDLAAPSSIKSIPSNGQNQDIVSMGLIAARKTLALCENVGTILSVLMAALNQASHFTEAAKYSAPIRSIHEKLGKVAPRYEDERPMSTVIAQVRGVLLQEQGLALAQSLVNLDLTPDLSLEPRA
uniref:Tyrosine 2,3-aminomutase n=1 Tax=Myxococcus fulvus TaxID=33 RepID=TAM_MYXFU|nr:RecName: Full=Tyrosine 2,3-aminomutase; Short=MfTAM; AltName: Full=Tyrosine ammonia-lyase [Myxococcus fulvus]CAR79033.1 tyrosine 2,3-aminomutase [Myxococcus fulvus Mx f65]